jgi:hypothetical protein
MNKKGETMQPKKKKQDVDDTLRLVLQRFERAEADFHDHPLWRQLGLTPVEFFAKNREFVERQMSTGAFSRKKWDEQLAAEKAKIDTLVREKRGQYQKTNLKAMTGLRG